MGLFSRKKQRDAPPQGPSTSARSPPAPSLTLPRDTEQQRHPSSPTESTYSSWSRAPPPTHSPSSRFGNPFRTGSTSAVRPSAPPAQPGASRGTSSQSSWDDAGVPLGAGGNGGDSPNLAPLDRHKLFGGGGVGKRASSSTMSLPLMNQTREEEVPRTRQSSAMQPVQEQEAQHEKSGWSRWKMGKKRQGSVSSFAGLGIGGAGAGGGEDGGFVVTSFRTVSRVHEDPVLRDRTMSPSTASPPLPALPQTAPLLETSESESLRNSLDYSAGPSSRNPYPRRPSLNTLGGSSPSSHAWERAPSPTITAEAFRLASARSKSSVSLASYRDDLTCTATAEHARPRFEPQRPSSRTSRRGSSFSDVGIGSSSPSPLQPPRPNFAIGQHSNSSSSSLGSHGRRESSSSIANLMLGTNELPVPPASRGIPTAGATSSESLKAAALCSQASDGRTALGTSPVASPAEPRTTRSPSSQAQATGRPAPPKRMSTDDSEMRLIAAYADSITSSPPCASPTELPTSTSASSGLQSRFSFSTPSLLPRAPAGVDTPRKPSFPSVSTATTATRLSAAPSLAVQPPTPVSQPGFSSASRASARPKRTSSLAPDAVKAALQTFGVGPGANASASASGKGKRAVGSRGWADSSDEEEQERLSTSDEEGDSSDDDVPLAQVQSRSQTDLSATLRAVDTKAPKQQRPSLAVSQASGDVEVLADGSASSPSGFALATAPSGSTLGRKGSNRRSMSTFSLSTSVTASQLASGAAAAVPPASPTSSILNRPFHQPRSVSNPTTHTSTPYYAQQPTPPAAGTPPPALSPAASPTFPASTSSSDVRDRSSSSSASGTASTSSAPLTPKDLSPSVSDLGLLPTPSNATKPSVKFDAVSLASNGEAQRWNRGRRLSAMSSGSSGLPTPPPVGGQQYHRSTPSLPTFAANAARSSAIGAPRPSFLGPPSRTPAGSRFGTTPTHSRPASTLAGGDSTPATSTSVPGDKAGDKGVYERMKARHKAESLQAVKIGRDLNHPSGLVPEEEERLEDSEDDDEPLANLPAKAGAGGSMIGGAMGGGGSMLGGMGAMQMGMQQLQMGMGMGGAYSPLAVAPPGVDPYLYASLPPDQKMSLHQRAQQMMEMMQQAAMQAHTESVIAGSTLGGGGSMLNGAGGGGQHVRGSMSMGGLDMMAGAGGRSGVGHAQHASMQFGGGMFGGADPYGTLPRGAHLPPFAPPFAMSQPFFQPPAPQSMYGMPAYAGSAIGFGGGAPASMMGLPTGPQRGRAGGRASSTIGMPQRR
ncbi:hypothetical protein JCM10213_004579 [Rhodosporidiobolus nylandii]